MQYQKLIRTIIRSFNIHGADADDCEQETYLIFISCKNEIRNEKAWITQVARRVCQKWIKYRRKQPIQLNCDVAENAKIDTKEILDLLPEYQRELIKTYYFDNIEVDKSELKKSLKTLRDKLNED